MKLFLTAFGLHNPAATAPLPGHAIIPVSVDCEGGLDLDYSGLLLAESFIMDKGAHDHVLSHSDMHFAPMAHTIEVLKHNQLLEVVDYKKLIVPYELKIVEKTSLLIEDVTPWIPIARRQWATVKHEFGDFHKRYGSQRNGLMETAHYGVSCLLHQKSAVDDLQELKRFEALLSAKRRRLNASEVTDFRAIIRPLVSQVVLNNLLRTLLNAPFFDWDDAQEFYHQLELGHWTGLDLKNETYDGAALMSQARCLFSIVVPELLPRKAEEVVEFIKNRRAVVSLRKELWELLSEGKPVSKDWFIELQNQAARAKIRSESRGRIIKWVGRIAGFAIPGSGPVADIVSDLIVAGGEHAAAKGWESRANVRYEWYHALQRLALEAKR